MPGGTYRRYHCSTAPAADQVPAALARHTSTTGARYPVTGFGHMRAPSAPSSDTVASVETPAPPWQPTHHSAGAVGDADSGWRLM
jgi:hypothetical protein